jgi:hypothetical protein
LSRLSKACHDAKIVRVEFFTDTHSSAARLKRMCAGGTGSAAWRGGRTSRLSAGGDTERPAEFGVASQAVPHQVRERKPA